MAIGQISRHHRLVALDLSGAVVSLQQIFPEKTHKCFGRVKEKKPPP
ncbi:uncharacterized protein G2W53_014949 [Senna tora]|uniref:Uncharacterized protein n=1 Tax=Senna tora TaxID=362788 RepID=A0A835C3F3_9FABA|nr:uncharacterized protein G2W53_014949 [Senna tora]